MNFFTILIFLIRKRALKLKIKSISLPASVANKKKHICSIENLNITENKNFDS